MRPLRAPYLNQLQVPALAPRRPTHYTPAAHRNLNQRNRSTTIGARCQRRPPLRLNPEPAETYSTTTHPIEEPLGLPQVVVGNQPPASGTTITARSSNPHRP